MTRRARAGIGLVLTVALGLASRKVHLGWSVWDKSLGDVLYTVMVFFVVVLAAPRLPVARASAAALGVSVAIELFQLTGIPAAMPRPLHWVFGTAFAWHDLVCYAVGAALTVGVGRGWFGSGRR